MKYLKSFKIFESSSSEDLIGTINDILLPISDSGVEYNIDNRVDIGLIHIKIKAQNEEVNNCIEHLENYLKDLRYPYFIGGSNIWGDDLMEQDLRLFPILNILIENNFNKEIEKDFLKIIDGIREVKEEDRTGSRFWINKNNLIIFKRDEYSETFYYSHEKIQEPFRIKYSFDFEIYEVVRYLVGKHLGLDIFPDDIMPLRSTTLKNFNVLN